MSQIQSVILYKSYTKKYLLWTGYNLLTVSSPDPRLAASPEAPAERGDPWLPGGLQRVQPWWEPPVHHHQPGHYRRHHREHRAGQPEEVHSVQRGGAGR